MVSTGFSDVMGSWKIMAISLPRTFCICCSLNPPRSSPLKRTSPLTILPGGSGTSFMMESALMLLPQPLSPTNASVSPISRSKLMSSTAFTVLSSWKKYVARFRTSSRFMNFHLSVACLAREYGQHSD